MNNPELLQNKYNKILNRYNQLYFGQFMRDEKIYEIMKDEFDLTETTLYRIVLKMSKAAANEAQAIMA